MRYWKAILVLVIVTALLISSGITYLLLRSDINKSQSIIAKLKGKAALREHQVDKCNTHLDEAIPMLIKNINILEFKFTKLKEITNKLGVNFDVDLAIMQAYAKEEGLTGIGGE